MKKLTLFLMILLLLSVLFIGGKQAVAYSVSTDLVLRMNMNEGEGAIIAIQNGSLELSRVGFSFNDPDWIDSLNATFGKGLDFDKVSSQYVSVVDHDLLSFSQIASEDDYPLTVDFWFYHNDTVDHGYIFAKGSDTLKEYGFRLDSEAALQFEILDGDGSLLRGATASFVANYQQWDHYAITYFGNAKTNSSAFRFYVNGSYQTTTFSGVQANYNGMNNTPGDFFIAADYAGNAEYLKGSIDEFRIWNESLSDSEVLDLFSISPALDQSEVVPETTTAATTTTPTTTAAQTGSGSGRGGAMGRGSFTVVLIGATVVISVVMLVVKHRPPRRR